MISGSEVSNSNPLVEHIFATLLTCHQKMSYNISKEMKAFGVTKQQYEVLKILSAQPDRAMNLNEVKSHLRENVPDISRIVQRLADKNLINRSRQSNDKRNSAISVNKKGIELTEQIGPVINTMMADFFGELSAAELQELSRIVTKVNENKA